MDARRFDGWTKALAARGTRRTALTTGAGAALLGMLGLRSHARAQATPGTGLGEDGVCRMQFEATTRFGPSTEAGTAAPLTGLLEFTVGDGGSTEGQLVLDSGEQYPVIGNATGRYLSLRIDIGDDVLIAVGPGERNARSCVGEFSGPTSGPREGDLGDWKAFAEDSGVEPSSGVAHRAAARPLAQTAELGLGADGICRMEFESNVRVRTSIFGTQPEPIRGLLELDIGDAGGITGDNSRLVLENGDIAPVLGQGPGQSIAFRIDLGEQTIVAVGLGIDRTSECTGTLSGRSIGPSVGDLGDWIATGGEGSGAGASTPTSASSNSSSNQPTPGSSGGSSGSNPTPTETPCELTQNDCSDLFLDTERCACICQNTGEPICGERCCTGGADCVDTTCVCPGGATYCEGHCLGCPPEAVCQEERCVCPARSFYCDSNNTCVPCQEGRTYDPNDCTCTSSCLGEIGAVCNGVCVDLAVDPANCGVCGAACATGQTCVNGTCQCAAGWTLCGDACHDLLTDRRHCGQCFFACGAFDSCIQGECG